MPQTEPKQHVAIMFVDICGSTVLFDQTTDVSALKRVAKRLDGLTAIAEAAGGCIIRSRGDDLLCTFVSVKEGLAAAKKMTSNSLPDLLPIHIGMHFGPVIAARGDIFGDAVNVAARMLDLANPGEIIVTEEFAQNLSAMEKGSLRALKQHSVKGKGDPLKIYSVVDGHDVTQIFQFDAAEDPAPQSHGNLGESPKAKVSLDFREANLVRAEGEAVLIGRSEHCDLVVDENCVSREHATIAVRRGRVILTDRSSTGTYIRPQGGEAFFVCRETLHLLGVGELSFGRSPDGNPNLIHFKQTMEH